MMTKISYSGYRFPPVIIRKRLLDPTLQRGLFAARCELI